ncbi:hypothetical protein [Paraburkholderia youngii]|uniref:hypothetical protein n=1 Tax=Paraburkholderia youngii TaxID=2782701 RepID=UPI003D1C1FB3
MSDITAERIESERRVRDYYRDAERIERAVVGAVRSGEGSGLPADVCTIAGAILDMPVSNRGLNVESVLVDRDDTRAQWIVLLTLRDGIHRTLAVKYPQ